MMTWNNNDTSVAQPEPDHGVEDSTPGFTETKDAETLEEEQENTETSEEEQEKTETAAGASEGTAQADADTVELEEETGQGYEDTAKEEQEKTETDEIADYDYGKIQNILSENQENNIELVKEKALGNILLIGATGFLGLHVLKAFLDSREDKVYALVRKGSYASSERRLKNLLMCYFDDPCDELFGERIVCIEADITVEKSLEKLKRYPFQTVLNCAAIVGRLTSGSSRQNIQAEARRNLVAFCREMGRRLIQISTVSVAGEGINGSPARDKVLGENELYIGQRITDEYIRTKFLAERYVLEAVGSGLDAKVIRVGNLMSRNSDGEFPIHSVTNGFLRRLRGYAKVGMFPMSGMEEAVEFSPVDSTAAAILKLAGTDKRFTLYHACNSHKISMGDLIHVMKKHGFDIRIVNDAEFGKAEKEYAAACEDSGMASGASNDGEEVYTIGYQNRFTMEVLQRLGYQWPVTDNCYLENVIDVLDKLEFFR